MTVLMIVGVIALLFLLIGFLRVGAIASFGADVRVRARVGVFRLTVYPKTEKAEKPQQKKQREKKPREKAAGKRPLPKPTVDELLDLLETLLAALGATAPRACRRLRIDPLELTVVFAGDPADVARSYGAASAAMYAFMPRMEACFCIPDPSLHLRMDYEAEKTSAFGTVGMSLRVCDLTSVFFTLALPMLKWYFRFRRAHRHDGPAHRGRAASEAKEGSNTEEKIA